MPDVPERQHNTFSQWVRWTVLGWVLEVKGLEVTRVDVGDWSSDLAQSIARQPMTEFIVDDWFRNTQTGIRVARRQSASSPTLATDKFFLRASLANQHSTAKNKGGALDWSSQQNHRDYRATTTDSIAKESCLPPILPAAGAL